MPLPLDAPAPGQKLPVTTLHFSQDCCVVAAGIKAPAQVYFYFLTLGTNEQWLAGDKHRLNWQGKIFLSFVSTPVKDN